MADTGAPHNLPYPTLADPPNGPDGFQDLAVQVAARLTAMVPPGSLLATARSTAPSGYLLCDGAAVSRSTYSDLFAAISTTYGAGNGTTTFNLPDLRGRVPFGVDGTAGRITGSDALGNTGGEEVHTLTAPEMPSHAHTVPNNHVGSGDGTVLSTSNLGPTAFNPTSTSSVGGGGAHNNMPPYQIVNWLVKV